MYDFETMKTSQAIANFVYNKMVEQGMPSMSLGYSGTCMYRSPEGRKCAVGHLIPDELYKENFEGDVNNLIKEIGSIIYNKNDPRNDEYAAFFNFLTSNKNLLDDLQSIHDSFKIYTSLTPFVDYFSIKMVDLQKEYGFNMNEFV